MRKSLRSTRAPGCCETGISSVLGTKTKWPREPAARNFYLVMAKSRAVLQLVPKPASASRVSGE